MAPWRRAACATSLKMPRSIGPSPIINRPFCNLFLRRISPARAARSPSKKSSPDICPLHAFAQHSTGMTAPDPRFSSRATREPTHLWGNAVQESSELGGWRHHYTGYICCCCDSRMEAYGTADQQRSFCKLLRRITHPRQFSHGLFEFCTARNSRAIIGARVCRSTPKELNILSPTRSVRLPCSHTCSLWNFVQYHPSSDPQKRTRHHAPTIRDSNVTCSNSTASRRNRSDKVSTSTSAAVVMPSRSANGSKLRTIDA
jgi:hypothetical protein